MDNETKNTCDYAIPLTSENTFNGHMQTESEKIEHWKLTDAGRLFLKNLGLEPKEDKNAE